MRPFTPKGFIIGLLLAMHVCIGLFAYDYFGDLVVRERALNVFVIDRGLSWAPVTSIVLFSLYIYVAGSVLILDHASMYKRHATRWAVASLAFTPILAGTVYYLTGLKADRDKD